MSKYEIESPFYSFLSSYCKNKVAEGAFFVLCVIVIIALFAPVISPQNPYDLADFSAINSTLPPGSVGVDKHKYILGTDDLGRDMLSAIFYGIRISISVGVICGFFSLIIGTLIGMLSAFVGGWIDAIIMRIADLIMGFPTFLIALILLSIFGRGIKNVVLALIISRWAGFAKIARGTAMAEREKEYIDAAKCLALPKSLILFKHLLPNCLPTLIVLFGTAVAGSISLEATLSFLGVGLPITEPSLGLLISNGFEHIIRGKLWISFYPGIALIIMIVSITIITDQLGDTLLNPRQK